MGAEYFSSRGERLRLRVGRCPAGTHNRVIGIAGQRPETKRASCEIGSGMAAQGGFGNKCAGIINRLFHAVGGVFAVLRNIRADVENIGSCKRRESMLSSIGQPLPTPDLLHRLNFTACLCAVDKVSTLRLQKAVFDMSRHRPLLLAGPALLGVVSLQSAA